jgi:hypothetical protein
MKRLAALALACFPSTWAARTCKHGSFLKITEEEKKRIETGP